jgi:hypothetical protein
LRLGRVDSHVFLASAQIPLLGDVINICLSIFNEHCRFDIFIYLKAPLSPRKQQATAQEI